MAQIVKITHLPVDIIKLVIFNLIYFSVSLDGKSLVC
jgi:hypothetical protein